MRFHLTTLCTLIVVGLATTSAEASNLSNLYVTLEEGAFGVSQDNSGTYAGVVGAGSDTWNLLSSTDQGNTNPAGAQVTGANALSYADGSVATGVTITAPDGTSGSVGVFSPGSAALNIFDTHWHESFGHGPINVVVSGLTGNSYDLYLYAARFDFDADTSFSVNGGAAQILDWGTNVSTFVENDNYLKLTASPVSGSITIAYDDNTTNGGGLFNAFQLVEIPTAPEPSTFVIAAFGLVGLGLARRRRRRG